MASDLIEYLRGVAENAKLPQYMRDRLTEAAAALEAAREDAAEAKQNGYELGLLAAAREDAEDAARYRWLCDGKGYFMEEAGLCHIDNEKPEADAAIDEAMRGEW